MALISVIVGTRNRPTKLLVCVQSIIEALNAAGLKPAQSEIVIVDQSERDENRQLLEFSQGSIHHHRLAGPGIARARNFGIQHSRGEFCLFTDDDCIVAQDWVSSVLHEFEHAPYMDAIFGRTEAAPLPNQTHTHHEYHDHYGGSCYAEASDGRQCYALKLGSDARDVDAPCLPHATLGSSNNMACRRRLLQEWGGFWERFGAGTWGFSAEDTEWQYRMLVARRRMRYAPRMRILHDAWLEPDAALRQIDRYLCGVAGVLAYYAARKEPTAKELLAFVRDHWRKAPSTCRLSPTTKARWRNVWRRRAMVLRGLAYGTGLRLLGEHPPCGAKLWCSLRR
jgi:glycosyltransferase involved in cell wall biosynthesis